MIEPRGVTIETAAHYVGLDISGYRAGVRRGIFPAPMKGTKRYDLRAIDRALDKLSGLACEVPPPALSPYDAWKAEQNGYRP
jgi:hypothetical protein